MVIKIISGGQTGSDRGGTESAHELGLQRGGWAPKGWRAEDGQIPEWYRQGMIEHQSAYYPARTERNVLDSDGTMLLSLGDLTYDSGSYLTAKLCRKHGRPYRHYKIPPIDQTVSPILVQMAKDWLAENSIKTLNVAGPRESRESGIQAATRRFLVTVLSPACTP